MTRNIIDLTGKSRKNVIKLKTSGSTSTAKTFKTSRIIKIKKNLYKKIRGISGSYVHHVHIN